MVKAFKPYFSPSITELSNDDELKIFKDRNPVFALALLKVKYIRWFLAMAKF